MHLMGGEVLAVQHLGKILHRGWSQFQRLRRRVACLPCNGPRVP